MITINSQTRIAEVIKINKASIEAIASLSKPLHKLRNPLLRRVMASRVTLAEAAAIGGCTLADFERVLRPLGFIWVETDDKPHELETVEQPDWFVHMQPERLTYFDVRGIIAGGEDPLKAIMQKFRALPEGNVLCIINSFVPYPLIKLLKKERAPSFVTNPEEKLYHTWFLKEAVPLPADPTTAGRVFMEEGASFATLLNSYDRKELVEIDVRHLEMPLPMETILATLHQLKGGEVLYVHHKRVPFPLLEALEDEPISIHIYEIAEGNVKMLFCKD